MRIFNTLSLELSATCNRSCVFCPVSVYKRPEEFIPKHLVTKAANELAELKYKGRVEFYIYNEPLKSRSTLYHALEVFKEVIPQATLMISTNGDYLKGSADLKDLYDRGLNQVILNAYSPKQHPKFIEWMRELNIDMEKNAYKPTARNARVGRALDKSVVEEFGKGVHSLQNRAGSIPEFLAVPDEPLKKMCVKPFRLLNINWEGEAMICCNDYYGDVEVGNLESSTLVELWEHPVFIRYRKSLLEKDRSLPLCRDCDCHSGAYPHLVDIKGGPTANKIGIEKRYKQKVEKRT